MSFIDLNLHQIYECMIYIYQKSNEWYLKINSIFIASPYKCTVWHVELLEIDRYLTIVLTIAKVGKNYFLLAVIKYFIYCDIRKNHFLLAVIKYFTSHVIHSGGKTSITVVLLPNNLLVERKLLFISLVVNIFLSSFYV